MKKFFSILLCLLTILSLIGCGKTEQPVSTDITAEAPQQETLPEVTVPEDASVEEEKPLTADDFIIETLNDSECEILGCLSDAAVLEVPEKINGLTVVGIGQGSFSNSDTKTVRLPNTVRYIKDSAFTNCYELEEVYLGNSLEEIGFSVFNFCPLLKKVTFPETLRSITGMCFGFCDTLEEVYIPATTTEIPDGIAGTMFCPNIVIVTPAGSVAESVATEAGLPVKNS